MSELQGPAGGSGARDLDRQRDPLARALQILGVMIEAKSPAFGVRQLAGLMSVSASTVHRLLGDLEQLGLVERGDEAAYRVGAEFYRLASAAMARFPLRVAAEEVLHGLASASTESAFLGVYTEKRREMTFAVCVESEHPLRYVIELNRWLPVHAGASGLAILSFLPDDERHELIHNTELVAVTEKTIVDPQQLELAVAEVRAAGFAVSEGQRVPGAAAVAAPVFGPTGAVVGDVGISMPAVRFDAAARARLVAPVVSAAAAVTARIGGGQAADRP